ncbi:hypothetical protein UCREL1_5651 [Eutypa lata UCREL1]|uniref:Clr5 domain-containing protein n=1 Tax=Eutypa lata (strain UCR-EL1) TaxID=1287681 RepID=M7SLT2_EUTLA|nr:hypothetical protein UCREL1_5651 [Eutypa lata UCREL1]
MEATDSKNQGASTNDWEANREIISGLYRDQNKTLKETMQIMADSHGFFASAKMYKTHIKKWGIDKNMKARDAIEIVRQQKARAAMGKSSVVYVRGRRVEPSKMQQYLHRVSEAVANEILLNTADDTVTDLSLYSNARVIVRTPSPELSAPGSPNLPKRLNDPINLRLPQECMQILTSYISGGYETGRWKLDSQLGGPDTINSCAWLGHLNTARDMISHNRTKQGFHLLGICLDQYKLHLLQPDADFWVITYAAVIGLSGSDPKLADTFISYASRLASIVLPPEHPFNLLWSRLAKLRLDGIRSHAPALLKAVIDTNSRYFTLMSPNRSYEPTAMYYSLHWLGMISAEDIARLNQEGVEAANSVEYGVQRNRVRSSNKLLSDGEPGKAELQLEEVVRWLKTQPAGSWIDLRMELHYEMFRLKTAAGKPSEIQDAAWDLYRFCMDAFGPGHYTTTFTGANLEIYFRHAGQTHVADRLRKDFEGQWKLLCKKARSFKKEKKGTSSSASSASTSSNNISNSSNSSSDSPP